MAVPSYDSLFDPLMQALYQLGGSSSVSEIEDSVAKILKLPDDDVNAIHRGNMTKFSYNLAWARSYLKLFGLLENSSRGVWSLTVKGKEIQHVDKEEIKRFVRRLSRKEKVKDKNQDSAPEEAADSWKEQLLEKILELPPPAFERLCQRLLRESGFVRVEVTGKSGDGGIDGKGVIRLGGLLSFYVVFQCKRYSGSVPCLCGKRA